jgi:hypothetical protein
MPSDSSKKSAADNPGKDPSTSKKSKSGKDSSTPKKSKSAKDSGSSKNRGNRAGGDEDFAVVEEYTHKAKVLQRPPALRSCFLTPQKDKNTPTPKSKK